MLISKYENNKLYRFIFENETVNENDDLDDIIFQDAEMAVSEK